MGNSNGTGDSFFVRILYVNTNCKIEPKIMNLATIAVLFIQRN